MKNSRHLSLPAGRVEVRINYEERTCNPRRFSEAGKKSRADNCTRQLLKTRSR